MKWGTKLCRSVPVDCARLCSLSCKSLPLDLEPPATRTDLPAVANILKKFMFHPYPQMAVAQIAELALLGAGDASLMFPTTLDEYEDAMAEEVPSRIAL